MVKVGDKFVRYYEWGNTVLDTRTVIKVSDKSIWIKDDKNNDVFIIRNKFNDHTSGVYMKMATIGFGSRTKKFFRLEQI